MKRSDSGFTLIELIVVVAILSVLAAAAVPTMTAIEAGEKYIAARKELTTFEIAVKAFAADAARAPTTMAELVGNTAGIPTWLGPYLTTQNGAAPQDPWGGAYVLEGLSQTSIRVVAPGADGKAGTDDDETRDIGVGIELRGHTAFTVDSVNRAIALYNAQPANGWKPLPSGIDAVITALKSGGYLNAGKDWSVDVFAQKLSTSGSPVTHVTADAGAATNGKNAGGGGSNSAGSTGSGSSADKSKSQGKGKG